VGTVVSPEDGVRAGVEVEINNFKTANHSLADSHVRLVQRGNAQ